MPNHCENDLYISVNSDLELSQTEKESKIDEFFEFIKERKRHYQQLADDMPQETKDASNPLFFFKPTEKERLMGIAKSTLSAHWFIPVPQHLYEGNSWCDWCTENWGTKWGLYDFTHNSWTWVDDEGSNNNSGIYKYSFESAWSPPIPIIQKMSEQFPDLVFQLEYFEQGGAYQGIVVYQIGVLVKEGEFTYYGNRGG